MNICIECKYQIASRICNQCGDDFCDSCYYSRHKLGRMRQHTFTKLIPFCQWCDKRTNVHLLKDETTENEPTLLLEDQQVLSDDSKKSWYMLDEDRDTIGPFTGLVMAGLYRSKRILPDALVCTPAGEWITASKAGLSKYGISSGELSQDGIEKNSALREIYAARVLCESHHYKEICHVCLHHSSDHALCVINHDLPVGTTATLNARKEEERLRMEKLKEEEKRYERELKEKIIKIHAAGRIQGWYRGLVGKSYGIRYMSRIRTERTLHFQKALHDRNRRRTIQYQVCPNNIQIISK